jgi:hypothetical protein
VQINGVWEDNSWIDRVEVDEIRLHKKDNSTVYTTLAAWLTDPTKYSTECFFRIKRLGVDWHTFYFGVRWGKIDKETGVYKFKPQLYDGWFKWIILNRDRMLPFNTDDQFYYDYYDAAGTSESALTGITSTDDLPYNMFLLYKRMFEFCGVPTIKSTLLNNDTSTVLTPVVTNGIVMDYVTGLENYFIYSGVMIKDTLNSTITSILKILDLFNISYFFESDTILRIEHAKYILSQFQDNAVSITFDIDEQEYEYIDESSPYLEQLSFYEDKTNTDTDFTNQEIIYSKTRTGLSAPLIKNQFNNFTDVELFESDPTSYDLELILASYYQWIFSLDGSGFDSFTSTVNTFSGEVLTGDIGVIQSNYFNIPSAGQDYDVEVYLTILSGVADSMTVSVQDTGLTDITTVENLVAGANTITLVSTGTSTSGMITLTFDNTLGGTGFTVEGWVIFKPKIIAGNTSYRYRIARGLGAISGVDKLNAPFSQANVLDNWYKIYRPTNAGTLNGVAKLFTDSQFIIRRNTKARYYPNDINMKYGINDGTRIAKIERYERDLDSDFVTFTLIYQEDE